LHLAGFSLTLNYDARSRELKAQNSLLSDPTNGKHHVKFANAQQAITIYCY
jgi:hypothetical protein